MNQGITFNVYGHGEGPERSFLTTCCRASSPARNGSTLKRGWCSASPRSILFLHDVYNEGKILNDGHVPREIVYSCRHFRREMRGLQVPRNVYITVTGTDLLRLEQRRICRAGR